MFLTNMWSRLTSTLREGQHSNEEVIKILAAYSMPRHILVINIPHRRERELPPQNNLYFHALGTLGLVGKGCDF